MGTTTRRRRWAKGAGRSEARHQGSASADAKSGPESVETLPAANGRMIDTPDGRWTATSASSSPEDFAALLRRKGLYQPGELAVHNGRSPRSAAAPVETVATTILAFKYNGG